ncbi:Methyl sulfide methyltransferase-associated sensor [uncultured archaeon]|nr:Methyl sulfide methyltransferase-associated sensor [uncultured archaeon]
MNIMRDDNKKAIGLNITKPIHTIAEETKHGVQLKEADEKLNNSEKYSGIKIESSFNGIAITDKQGNFEYVNDFFLKIIDWPEKEIIGQSFMKIFPEAAQEFIQECWKEFQKGIEIPYLTMIRSKSGEIRYIHVSHSKAEIGGKKHYVSIIKDIPGKKKLEGFPENKKLELALKESEDMYRDIFENAIDAMYINDIDGYILNVNKAGLRGLGCSAEDIIGTHASRWFTPESTRLTMGTVRKKILGKLIEDPMIRQVITKGGEKRWVEIRSRVIKKGDSILGYHGIARDVTEKTELEQKLKESEAKYRELFENAQDAMYVLDTRGNFLKLNQVGLRILGCTKDEVIGTNISKWLTQESSKLVKERREKWKSGETVDKMDILELVGKNGEHRWIEIKTRHIKDGGRTIEIHGIARDVTENIILKHELKNSNRQRKLLCYLIKGTRGGKTRTLILRHLTDRSYNAHQLAKALNIDYKTVRHHLEVLVKNGIVTKDNGGYSTLYFISKNIQSDLNEFNSELL